MILMQLRRLCAIPRFDYIKLVFGYTALLSVSLSGCPAESTEHEEIAEYEKAAGK